MEANGEGEVRLLKAMLTQSLQVRPLSVLRRLYLAAFIIHFGRVRA